MPVSLFDHATARFLAEQAAKSTPEDIAAMRDRYQQYDALRTYSPSDFTAELALISGLATAGDAEAHAAAQRALIIRLHAVVTLWFSLVPAVRHAGIDRIQASFREIFAAYEGDA